MPVSRLTLLAASLMLWMAFCVWPSGVKAQWTMGGRAVALAKTGTALPSDRWALFHNPALIDVNERYFGLFVIRYYGFRELEDHAAIISLPVRNPHRQNATSLGMAAGIHSYGFELYRETHLRGGWALHRNRLRFGMVINYAHLQISGYGSTGMPVFDAGLAIELDHGFLVGSRVANLFPDRNGAAEIERYPVEVSFGASWNGLPHILLTSEIVKDVLFPVSIRTAMELEGADGIFFRGGWTTAPLTWSAGAGFQLTRITVNLAIQKHTVLGLSPGMDCSVNF